MQDCIGSWQCSIELTTSPALRFEGPTVVSLYQGHSLRYLSSALRLPSLLNKFWPDFCCVPDVVLKRRPPVRNGCTGSLGISRPACAGHLRQIRIKPRHLHFLQLLLPFRSTGPALQTLPLDLCLSYHYVTVFVLILVS